MWVRGQCKGSYYIYASLAELELDVQVLILDPCRMIRHDMRVITIRRQSIDLLEHRLPRHGAPYPPRLVSKARVTVARLRGAGLGLCLDP